MQTSFLQAVAGMARVHQWHIWRLVPNAATGKYDKLPCTLDGQRWPINAGDAVSWHAYSKAAASVAHLDAPGGPVRYALGFWLTRDCGYWFLDLDHARGADGDWLPYAAQLCAAFPGAMVEASSSGNGLHVIGRGDIPPHRNRPPANIAAQLAPLSLEFYTADRSICFGLDGAAQGCADTRFDLAPLCQQFFPPREEGEFSGERNPAWRGPSDDDELIRRMLSARQSAAAAFGGKAALPQLWRGEVTKDSEADMALAAHLAWWTGADAERVERLMLRSGLTRPKWSERRPGGTYLSMTVARACETCDTCYQEPAGSVATNPDDLGAASLTTELSNAYRLQAAHGDNLMAVTGMGWHVWGGAGPWLQDDHAAHRLAFGLGKAVQAEADALDDWVHQGTLDGMGTDECKRRADIQKNRARWAKASESKAVIDHSLALAERLLGVPPDTLDASPLLVGCPGGVLDLATCMQREHRKADRITKRIAVDYDPTARAPLWERFVAEIMGGNAELIAYLQTLCGYMLSGVRGEHLLPVFHGTGANGKSTFLMALQDLLGDYAGTAAPGLLISRSGSDHPTGLAALQGRRLVVVSETGEAGRLNEDQVKALTGGDRIAARRMRQDFYSFDPTHIIVLQTNHKPRVTGTDEGIWRRVKLIPFNVTVPPERRDANLPQKLGAERAGILAWVVEGWKLYQLQRFQEPAAVLEATADYRSNSDHVGAFIADRCNVGQNFAVPAGTLYMAYKLWAAENGEHPLTQRSLGVRLAERPGITSGRTKHARTWVGLGIDAHAHLGLPALGA